MENYILLIPLISSFFVTLFMLPYWINKSKLFGFVGKDMNKAGEPKVSEGGGLIAVAGFILGILIYVAIKQFFFNSDAKFIEIFALTTSLLMLTMIGIIDGSLGWKIGLRRRIRIALCLFAAVPLMVINAGQSSISLPFFGVINLGLFYPLIIIPLGLAVTSTTFNFLAGFNGLEAGQGIIFLSALSLVAYFTGHSWLAFIGLIVVVSLVAFLLYNFYPSKVFPGDVLTYPIGGLIAIMAVLGNFERIALFFFIPYIIEVILKSRGGLTKQSFGLPKESGNLELRYNKFYSLNHVAIYLLNKTRFKATERRVVFAIWAFQIIFIILGFIIFRGGIFN